MAANNEDRSAVNSQDGLAQAVTGSAAGDYLGDPRVVDQLVRDFMTAVFSSRADWHQDGDDAGATGKITLLCKKYGDVFMGRSNVYSAQPWNSPHRLGAYLRAAVEDSGDFEDMGEAYFHFLAVQALNASIALEQETMTEDQVKAGMTEVVEDAVEVLLGRKMGGQ